MSKPELDPELEFQALWELRNSHVREAAAAQQRATETGLKAISLGKKAGLTMSRMAYLAGLERSRLYQLLEEK